MMKAMRKREALTRLAFGAGAAATAAAGEVPIDLLLGDGMAERLGLGAVASAQYVYPGRYCQEPERTADGLIDEKRILALIPNAGARFYSMSVSVTTEKCGHTTRVLYSLDWNASNLPDNSEILYSLESRRSDGRWQRACGENTCEFRITGGTENISLNRKPIVQLRTTYDPTYISHVRLRHAAVAKGAGKWVGNLQRTKVVELAQQVRAGKAGVAPKAVKSTAAPPSSSASAPHPPQPTPKAEQPQLGPNIYYNRERNLRYVVQRDWSAKHKTYLNYRRYESKLNKGDWGQGGVVPQDPSPPANQLEPPAPPAPAPAPPAPPAPAPAPPAPAPAPQLGPNIFFNEARSLRYVVRNSYSQTHKRNMNFRYYESALNKGDWGQGGVVPQ